MTEQTEYDTGPNIASVKKMVWKDVDHNCRDLQQMFEKDQEERRRREVLEIPILLPGPGLHNKQTALFRLEETHM